MTTTQLNGHGPRSLSIAYGILRKQDGNLEFSSTPGEGSCFVVSLLLG